MDAKETVLLFLVAFQVLVSRSFGKVPIQTIRPAVVSASEDLCAALFLLHYRISTVSADVVESINVSRAVSVDDYVVSCNIEAKEVAGILNTRAVRHE